MSEHNDISVCIVGAGAMGVVTGYHLSKANASVTFLVRPHRKPQLQHPQKLFSLDDNEQKIFSDYQVLTSPSALSGKRFDYVLITLDGAALRNKEGVRTVDAVGEALKHSSGSVILGSVGIETKAWFTGRTELPASRVTNGILGALVYDVKRAQLPVSSDVDAASLAAADYAYRHLSPYGFTIDGGSPEVAESFAALFDRNGITKCSVVPESEFRAIVTGTAMVGAWELLDWKPIKDIDPENATWKLGAEAMREFQHLSVFGPEVNAAADSLTPESLHQMFLTMEQSALPLDSSAFNRYHHGEKVNEQDHLILQSALKTGESEGLAMPALRALLEKLLNRKGPSPAAGQL